jgi:hypothetical protein
MRGTANEEGVPRVEARQHDDPLILQLEDERQSLRNRLAAVEQAIHALTGSRPDGGSNMRSIYGRSASVGDDKLAAVHGYIKQRGKVRQAEIVQELGLNSGTVSTATHALLQAGEIERGPKENRSVTWRAVK